MKKIIVNYLLLILFLLLIFVGLWQLASPVEVNEFVRDAHGDIVRNLTPAWYYPLGTDVNGYDNLLRLSVGLSRTLYMGLYTVVAFLLTGIPIGIALGFRPAKSIISLKILKKSLRKPRIIALRLLQEIAYIANQTFQAIPLILVLIATVIIVQRTVSNPEIRIYIDMVVLGVFASPKLAVTLEERIMRLKRQEFILAAKAGGLSQGSIIFKHILWGQCRGNIILNSLNTLLMAAMMEILLTYFHFGANEVTLGNLIKQNIYYLSWDSMATLPPMSVVSSLTPFLIVIILCLTIRWLGERIIEVSQA